jgi:hypothetical protein
MGAASRAAHATCALETPFAYLMTMDTSLLFLTNEGKLKGRVAKATSPWRFPCFVVAI